MSVRSVLNNSGVFNYAKAGSSGLSAKSLIITEGDLTFADGSIQSTASTQQDPTNWSDFPAVSNIVCSTYGIQDSTSSLGTSGQLLSSQGGSLVWTNPPSPILTTPAPSGSNYLLANGQDVYNNAILTYTNNLGAKSITASDSNIQLVSTTIDDTASLAITGLQFINPSVAQSGLSSNSLYFTDNIGNTININGVSSIITVQDSGSVYSGIYDNTRIYFRETSSGDQASFSRNGLRIESSSAFSNFGLTSLVFNNSTFNTAVLNGSNSTLTLFDGTNTSILSPTNLTFNGASLVSTVGTNTSNIATNTTNIATNTTNIANNQIKLITATNQNISAVIYADAKPPLAPTTTIAQQYAFTPSWYFKNSFASNNKINWYIGADIGMTVSQVLGLYMNIFNGANTSNDNCPFITFYTKPQTGDPNFYHSKRTYIFNQSISPIANTRYFMFQNMTGSCPTPFHYGSTLINMALTPVGSSNFGPFLPTEEILAFSIGTNSVATINTIEFAIDRFGIMTANGTQQLNFIPL